MFVFTTASVYEFKKRSDAKGGWGFFSFFLFWVSPISKEGRAKGVSTANPEILENAPHPSREQDLQYRLSLLLFLLLREYRFLVTYAQGEAKEEEEEEEDEGGLTIFTFSPSSLAPRAGVISGRWRIFSRGKLEAKERRRGRIRFLINASRKKEEAERLGNRTSA